jgi:hypothetical protein
MRVVNASPLIVLSHLARLDLLREPGPEIEVAVSRAVLDEVMMGDPDDPAVSLVPAAVGDWLRVIPTPDDDLRVTRPLDASKFWSLGDFRSRRPSPVAALDVPRRETSQETVRAICSG